MSKRKPTSLVECMKASPTFRVTLAPQFVRDLAIATAIGVDDYAAYVKAFNYSGSRACNMAEAKTHARYVLKLAKGMTFGQVLDLVPEADRAATESVAAEDAAMAHGFVAKRAQRAIELDAYRARVEAEASGRRKALAS